MVEVKLASLKQVSHIVSHESFITIQKYFGVDKYWKANQK
jgi:hypothetical protein